MKNSVIVINTKNTKKIEEFLKKENFNFEIFYNNNEEFPTYRSHIINGLMSIVGTTKTIKSK